MRRAKRELKMCIRDAKDSYRKTLETRLKASDICEAWNGMKTITSWRSGSKERANKLNIFYNRFLNSIFLTQYRPCDPVRILVIYFLGTFNTIQPLRLKGKPCRTMKGPCRLTHHWCPGSQTTSLRDLISSGLRSAPSDIVSSNSGVPQGTVLAPLLFALYTADFMHNTELCHTHKFCQMN